MRFLGGEIHDVHISETSRPEMTESWRGPSLTGGAFSGAPSGEFAVFSSWLAPVGRKPSCRTALAALLLATLLRGPAFGAAVTSPHDENLFEMPRRYICYRANGPIRVDGELDEPSWETAPWTEEFVDIEGEEGPRPRLRTRAKMLWDDKRLYVGAKLEEPHVWATLTAENSHVYNDNDFEVFIDPDSDNQEYFEFEINALNTVWNLFLKRPYRNGGPWMVRGMEGQESGVHVDGTLNDATDVDEGWSLEVAFPWTGVTEHVHGAAPPRDGDRWRVNFSRVEWETVVEKGRYQKASELRSEHWAWSPQGVVDMHRPERWGYVQFSTAATPPADFQPDPTIPARNLLMRVYYAQEIYCAKHGRYAEDLKDLDMPGVDDGFLVGPLHLQVAGNAYEATAEIHLEDRRTQQVHVIETSRIWADPPRRR
ncbi:MAG TPA: carbohydrate-binding family 9-like protein [Sumerlaeia bacterium]|nr:carbohydrate-binding family 9-like protein [Sumerlaeia bacterium]